MRWFCVLAVFLGNPLSSAIAEPVDWNLCVTETSKANADLNSSRSALKAAEYQFNGAFSGFFPQVFGSLGYSRQNTTGTGSSDFYNASINATANLFSGFQDRAKADQASAGLDLARATLDLSRANVSFDLTSAFASLLFAQNSLKLSYDIARRREENLRLVELRYEGGMENKGSFFLSQAALSQAQYEVLQATDGIASDQEQLARMLGRNSADDLTISGDLPVAQTPPLAPFDPMIPILPEHRQSAAQEALSRAALTTARSPFYPSLNASAAYGKQGTDWFPGDTRWSAGLTLTIPLFNGGRDYFGSRAAVETLSASAFNREGTDRRLKTRLRQNYNGFMEADQKLKVDQEFLKAATVRAEIARNKYNNGLLSFEDWDIIENDLIVRQKAVLLSVRDRAIAAAAWEQAQGKGVIP